MNVISVDEVLEFANLIFEDIDRLMLFNAIVEITDDRLSAVTVEGDEAAAEDPLSGEFALLGRIGDSVHFISFSLDSAAPADGQADDLRAAIEALPGGDAPDHDLLDDVVAAGGRTIAVLVRSVNDRGERLARLYHHPLLTTEDAGAFLKDAMKQYGQKPPSN